VLITNSDGMSGVSSVQLLGLYIWLGYSGVGRKCTPKACTAFIMR
jgi:hypothetical protein